MDEQVAFESPAFIFLSFSNSKLSLAQRRRGAEEILSWWFDFELLRLGAREKHRREGCDIEVKIAYGPGSGVPRF
jgi:hypothetical protein